MISIDCERCPSGPEGCDGCLVSVLLGENVQVGGASVESCGYVLAPEIQAAVDVLLEAGLLSEVRILEEFEAA